MEDLIHIKLTDEEITGADLEELVREQDRLNEKPPELKERHTSVTA